jgi:hypothetical protein
VFTQSLTEMSFGNKINNVSGVKCGGCIGLSRLSGQCGILNISQPYRPPWAVMEIAFLIFIYTVENVTLFTKCVIWFQMLLKHTRMNIPPSW